MKFVILRTISRVYLYIITLFSLYLLVRGHNEPGGGFIGGLLTASAILLQALAFDAEYAERLIPPRESLLVAWGLFLALGTGLWSMLAGRPFLDQVFDFAYLPFFGHVELASAVIFDIGVYLVVVGTTKWAILTIARDERKSS